MGTCPKIHSPPEALGVEAFKGKSVGNNISLVTDYLLEEWSQSSGAKPAVISIYSGRSRAPSTNLLSSPEIWPWGVDGNCCQLTITVYKVLGGGGELRLCSSASSHQPAFSWVRGAAGVLCLSVPVMNGGFGARKRELGSFSFLIILRSQSPCNKPQELVISQSFSL